MNNIYQTALLDRPTPIQTRIEAEEYAVVPLGTSKRQTILNPRKETMKIRLPLAVVGLAISFALPIFAQQTETPDAHKAHFKFQDVINTNDPTFNQELGINTPA